MRRTYTAAECAEAAKSLAAAKAAKLALATGQTVTRIRHADKDMEFSEPKYLLAFIREMQGIVDSCAGCRRTPTGSFQFVPH